MHPRRQIGTMAAIAILAIFNGSMAMADHHAKSGTFDYLQALTTDYTTVKRGEETITAGSIKGSMTIIRSSGGPFKEGSSNTQVSVVHVKKSVEGIDLVADGIQIDSDGDQVYIYGERKAGDIAVGGGGKGTVNLIGGTGKYDGVNGICEYTVEYLPDNRIVTLGSCDWQRN